MTQHLIWTAGLLGHLVLVAVLVTRGWARRFPCFTLLIVFDVVRTLALASVLGHLSPAALHSASVAIDIADLLIEFAVLIELMLTAIWPLGTLRRITWPLMLLACGALIVTRVASVKHYNAVVIPLLLHFLLGVLFVEWSLALALLMRPLNLHWRRGVAAITFGFGLYSAALILAGGYFRVGRDLSDFVFFSYLRISVYLFVVLWWIVTLWTKPDSIPSRS